MVVVDRAVAQIIGKIPEQLHQLLGIEDDFGSAGDGQPLGIVAGFGLGELVGDLPAQGLQVQGVEIDLLVKLHALAALGGGGDGLDHGGPALLLLVQTTAVDHRLRDPVDEDLHRVQAGDSQGVGAEDGVGDLGSQIVGVVIGEIRLDGVFSGLGGGERVVGIRDQRGLFDGLADQPVQLRLRGGGVDEEGGMALACAVGHIDGDLPVAVVGVADRLQGTLDEEQLVALLAGPVDLVFKVRVIGLQVFDNGIHPSFALAFTQGPPSLTRTHSL